MLLIDSSKEIVLNNVREEARFDTRGDIDDDAHLCGSEHHCTMGF